MMMKANSLSASSTSRAACVPARPIALSNIANAPMRKRMQRDANGMPSVKMAAEAVAEKTTSTISTTSSNEMDLNNR